MDFLAALFTAFVIASAFGWREGSALCPQREPAANENRSLASLVMTTVSVFRFY